MLCSDNMFCMLSDKVEYSFILCRSRTSADAERLTKPAGAGVDVVVTAGDQHHQ